MSNIPESAERESVTYITVHGNYIKEQNITVQSGANFYNGAKPDDRQKPDRTETAMQLAGILGALESGAQMFCVLKGIVLAGKAGNLHDADEVLRELYPAGIPVAKPYNLNRIETDLHVQSFTKDVERWDLDDSPLKSRGMFSKYLYLTKQVKELFESM